MKSSLKKLRGFALHKGGLKEKRENETAAQQDELLQASQDMRDIRNCYDTLLSAAAATANSAYEFSEALREMGTCLLERTALNGDEESGRVLLMLGKAQFELQKLVNSYRAHIIQTITTPSESLLKELQTVEDMKRQCDDKRDFYKSMLAAQREKGRSRNTKGENFSSQQLQAAKEDYEEETTLFVFRLKSLKQGQFRSLLTQAARHHAAQLNLFRKGFMSLEMVEPHVKAVAEQQHIDYQFSGLEDNDAEEADENYYSYDGNDDGELSFDYALNGQGQDVGSLSRNSMELDQADNMNFYPTTENAQENLDRYQTDLVSFNKGPRAVSMSAPILADKQFESSERIKPLPPSSARKFHTYVLPTPIDAKSSSLISGNSVSAPRLESKGGWPTQLWHSSPLEPDKPVKDYKSEMSSPTRLPKGQSVLKESNINGNPTRMPPPSPEGLSLPQLNPQSASDTKKIKRHAYSGPLTSKAWSSKPMLSVTETIPSVEHPPVSSAKPARAPTQPSGSPRVSPSASPPPMLSPRINELHQLPRPPSTAAKPTRPSSLVGHSAPLVSRGQEFSSSNKLPIASQRASPLPTPPVVMARSFSIPSSGPRTPTKAVAKSLEASYSQDMTEDISSPPLTPISLTSNLPASESVTRATKPKDLS